MLKIIKMRDLKSKSITQKSGKGSNISDNQQVAELSDDFKDTMKRLKSGMSLSEFISTTLKEIVNGIETAQEATKESEAIISPYIKHNDINKMIIPDSFGRHITPIEFQVALTKSDKSEDKTGIGVFFSVMGVGASEKTDAMQTAVNSIKFMIPVILPNIIKSPKHKNNL